MKTKHVLYIILTGLFLSNCVVNNITVSGEGLSQTNQKPKESVPKAIPVVIATPTVVPQKAANQPVTRLKKTEAQSSSTPLPVNTDPRKVSLTYNLTEQTGTLVVDGKLTHTFPFSSGKIGYSTPYGTFVAGEKHPNKWSTKYKCWMPLAIEIKDPKGVHIGYYNHEGRVPENNYPASHGCIRLRPGDARILYGAVPTGATIHIVGSAREHLQKHFVGYHLLDFGNNDDPKIKRNNDGSLTAEFVEYVQSGKMEIYNKDQNGKKVGTEDGVLVFEFMEDPWRQGVPVREYRSWMKGYLARQ